MKQKRSAPGRKQLTSDTAASDHAVHDALAHDDTTRYMIHYDAMSQCRLASWVFMWVEHSKPALLQATLFFVDFNRRIKCTASPANAAFPVQSPSTSEVTGTLGQISNITANVA